MLNMRFGLITRICLTLILAAAAGCTQIGAKSELPPQEAVRLRAQAWADELLAGDVEGAWRFTSPTYRQFSPVEQYKVRVLGSGRWTSAEVNSVKCDEDVCDVGIMVEYHIAKFNMGNRRVLDFKWVKVDGDWWLHVPPR